VGNKLRYYAITLLLPEHVALGSVEESQGVHPLRVVSQVLNLLFPPKCCICGHYCEELLCKTCQGTLPLVEGPICTRCGKPCHYQVKSCRECRGRRLYFHSARSLGFYEGSLKEAIHNFKYKNGRRLANIFADLARNNAFCDSMFWDIDLITYVPSTTAKEIRRGYNQAELFGREVAKRIEKPSIKTLCRVKQTEDQNKLKLEERRKNVKDAFKSLPQLNLKNRRILLVDDVYTTGSTINECAKALKRAEAKQVNVLTVARATLNY